MNIEEIITFNKVIINCGHFLVISDNTTDKSVYTSILNFDVPGEKKEQIFKEFGEFSFGTFELGVELLNSLSFRLFDCKLTILVNDWQRIEKDIHRDESNPNKFRNQFFKSFIDPPQPYTELIQKFNLTESIWFGDNIEDYFFFRETRLRDRFKRNIKKLSKEHLFALDDQMCLTSCSEFNKNIESNTYYHYSKEFGTSKLAERGKVGCAGEITQLIFEINQKQHETTLINILPNSCSQSVILGSKIAFDFISSLEMQVINVFPNENSIKDSSFIIINHENELHTV
ncbi:MAG: hypothetical protein IH597_01535 [Bacteroidales bacterium]|nr:hypothetical protein [Bacteroidales bacterium]